MEDGLTAQAVTQKLMIERELELKRTGAVRISAFYVAELRCLPQWKKDGILKRH